MSAPLAPNAIKSLQEAYAKVSPPRVFSVDAGRHWGTRAPKLNAEQFRNSLEAVHEQYQRGYRGRRLRRNAAMRMASHCNTNSLLILVLPAIAGQLISIYLKWRTKEGITEPSGVFATRPPSSQMIRK